MSENTPFIRSGFHSLAPYLYCQKASEAIVFYTQVFSAKEQIRLEMPNGKIAYACLQIGNSYVMLADEFPEMNVKSPQSLGGSPVHLQLYVPDVDAIIATALETGAILIRPIQNQFFGDRSGLIQDPFGHFWNIATCLDDYSNEEIKNRFKTGF